MLVWAKLAMLSQTSVFYKYWNVCLKSCLLTSSGKFLSILQKLTEPCESFADLHQESLFLPLEFPQCFRHRSWKIKLVGTFSLHSPFTAVGLAFAWILSSDHMLH